MIPRKALSKYSSSGEDGLVGVPGEIGVGGICDGRMAHRWLCVSARQRAVVGWGSKDGRLSAPIRGQAGLTRLTVLVHPVEYRCEDIIDFCRQSEAKGVENLVHADYLPRLDGEL